MANLLVLILNDLEKCPMIIEAWERAGVAGITLLDSIGSRQLCEHASRDDIPLMPSLNSLFASDEAHNRTLVAVIQDDGVLERAISAAQNIVGDFAQPNTGILFVVPVSRTWGVPPQPRQDRGADK